MKAVAILVSAVVVIVLFAFLLQYLLGPQRPASSDTETRILTQVSARHKMLYELLNQIYVYANTTQSHVVLGQADVEIPPSLFLALAQCFPQGSIPDPPADMSVVLTQITNGEAILRRAITAGRASQQGYAEVVSAGIIRYVDAYGISIDDE
jgi:hypothetical protein